MAVRIGLMKSGTLGSVMMSRSEVRELIRAVAARDRDDRPFARFHLLDVVHVF